MTITHISKGDSNSDRIAFVTEPPLDNEVFSEFLKVFKSNGGGPSVASSFRNADGLLTHSLSGGGLEDVKFWQECLTKAEKNLDQRQKQAEDAHEKLLREVSTVTGLPVK